MGIAVGDGEAQAHLDAARLAGPHPGQRLIEGPSTPRNQSLTAPIPSSEMPT
jgi:hypothetical protein